MAGGQLVHHAAAHGSQLIKAAVAPTRRSTISKLAIAVKAGPIYENAWTSGTSHILRRMAYRDNFISSGWRLNFDLTNAGLSVPTTFAAELVARQFILYSVTGPSDTVLQDAVISKLAQMVFFPRFHQRDVQLNYEHIHADLKELKHHHPANYVKEYLFQIAFKGSPHGNPVLCPDHNLKAIGQKQLWDAWENFYTEDNVAFVGSNVNVDELNHLVEENEWVGQSHSRKLSDQAKQTLLLPQTKYYGGNYTVIHRREREWDEQYNNVNDTWTGVGISAPAYQQKEGWLCGWIAKAAIEHALQEAHNDTTNPGSKTFYEAMDGAGLVGTIITNFNKGPSKKTASLVQNAVSPAEVKKHFESLKASALISLTNYLNDSSNAVNSAVLGLMLRGSVQSVSTLQKDFAAITADVYDKEFSKHASLQPTVVYYGGKPLVD